MSREINDTGRAMDTPPDRSAQPPQSHQPAQ